MTGEPIANAQIIFGNSAGLTDSLGKFEIHASACDIKSTVSKKDYKPFGVKLDREEGRILIYIDNETHYRDIETPKYFNSDSTSFITAQLKFLNSTHFEYEGETNYLKIYLDRK